MDIENLHKLACEKKEDTYIDPNTKFLVFTKKYHQERGNCCGNKCRHCPYNWINVKNKLKIN